MSRPTRSRATAEVKTSGKPIKVTIKRNPTSGRFAIEFTPRSIVAPPVFVVFNGFHDAEHRKQAMFYYHNYGYTSYERLIEACGTLIPLNVWASTLAAAAARGLTYNEDEAEASIIPSLANDVYITIGGMLLKAEAVGLVRTNRALAAVKARAIALAQAEARQVVSEAEAKADRIITDANLARQNIDAQTSRLLAELARLRAEQTLVPPSWCAAAGYELHFFHGNSCWELKTNLSFKPLTFSARNWHNNNGGEVRRIWPANPSAPAVNIPVWVPVFLDGSVQPRRMRTVSHNLPHISPGSACMELSSPPTTLASVADVQFFLSSVSRCMQDVNLDSLLAKPREWSPEARAFIPPAILIHCDRMQTGSDFDQDVVAPNTQNEATGDEIWRTQVPIPAPPTPETPTPEPIDENDPPTLEPF